MIIPNLLSVSRIVLCLPLLLVDTMTMPFWVLYVIAGLTDMLDGFLARRWGVESKFGARLDSLADFVFVMAVGYKMFPWLKLPTTLWMMIGLIAMIKVTNAISSYVVAHRIKCLEQREPPNLFGWPSRDRQRQSQCLEQREPPNLLGWPSRDRQRLSQFPHTKANKITGFLLFVGMMTIRQSYFIPVAWVIAYIALFAAIQEGYLIRSYRSHNH